MKIPTVKASLYLIKQAWNEIWNETVKNCWNHVDIIRGVNDNTGQLEKINSDQRKCVTELGELLKK